MEKNNIHYSFREFLQVFKSTNWKTWGLVVTIITGVFSFLSGFNFYLPQSLFPYFLLATLLSAPIFIFNKAHRMLFNLYKELEKKYQTASSLTESLTKMFGYKRLLFRKDIVVRGDKIVEISNKFVIKASHELHQITLVASSYPGINNKVITEDEKRFITFEDYSKQGLGDIETDIVSDGMGTLYYLVKFDRNLKITDPPVTIKTKIEFPESGLDPDPIYKKVIAENGKMTGIAILIPMEKIEIKITFPKEKKYQPLDCLEGCFCSMSRIGSDVKREPTIKCEESANEFEFSVDNPVFGMVYYFCWKEKDIKK